MEKKKSKINLTPNKVAIIASIMALLGLYLLTYDYIKDKKQYAYDYMAGNILSEKAEIVHVEYDESDSADIEEPETTSNEYIGYLEIPKISLNKGFLSVKAEDNDVEKNLYVVPGSSYPNKKNGNLIIAAHSGTGWKAFFNDLYMLTIGDEAYVTYKELKYTYRLVDIYTEPKTGTVTIDRDYNKNVLTLITCTNDNDTTQTIYILELTSTQ